MKKYLLFIFALLIFNDAYSQRKKEFQIRGGLGWSVYSTTTEFSVNYNGFTFSNTTDDNAATVHLPLELRYEISRRFNIGLDMKFGSYLYDPDSADGKSNRFVVIGIAGEYNFISKDNFRWYGGVGFTSASLDLEENYDSFSGAIKNISKYKGPGFRINTGILWFFQDLLA